MPTSTELLRPAYLKIERAQHHINDLNQTIAVYLIRQPFALVLKEDGQAGKRTLCIEQQEPFPDAIPLILGDAIHNLRSALDLTIFGMIGGIAKKPESVQFPFARRSDTLVSTITNREIHLAGENVVAAIKEFQPYSDGNELLYSLYTLDICDKHKLIIPVAGTGEMPGSVFNLLVPNISTGRVGLSLKSRIEQSFPPTANGQPSTKKKTDAQPTFKICLDDGSAVPNEPIIERLAKLTICTRDVVDRLVAAFLSERAA